MIETIISRSSIGALIKSKSHDYLQLMKFRLTLSVVFSSAMGYLLASKGVFNFTDFFILIGGGFLIVASSNGINQIIERNFDKLMTRTANRPVATHRMGVTEAAVFCFVIGVVGVSLHAVYLNKVSAMMGLLSLICYSFIYTPLKRVSPLAVHVGAFPGAISPAIGWVAFTGVIDTGALVLFALQFLWQFPHFWSIAWMLDDDYKKAGYRLLPSKGGRDRNSAIQSLVFALLLVPMSFALYFFGITGIISAVFALIASLYFGFNAYKLVETLEMKEAKKLMFTSFFYLPVILMVFVFDKL